MTLPSQQIGGFQAAGWFGVLGAARTQQPIVTRINAEMTAFMSEPGLRDKLVAQGAEPMAAPPNCCASISPTRSRPGAG
jgi:tripartite-type tricarboxylate transporter receptor subunit TctC